MHPEAEYEEREAKKGELDLHGGVQPQPFR